MRTSRRTATTLSPFLFRVREDAVGCVCYAKKYSSTLPLSAFFPSSSSSTTSTTWTWNGERPFVDLHLHHLRRSHKRATADTASPAEPLSSSLPSASSTRNVAAAAGPAPGLAGAPEGSNNDASSNFWSDTFDWGDLGLHAEVTGALEDLKLPRPSHTQAASIPRCLDSQVVVIASETGSGKTLAYLLPVLSQLLDRRVWREEHKRAPAELAQYAHGVQALILCPTGVLCDQVLDVIQRLRGEHNSDPTVTTTATSATHPGGKHKTPLVTAVKLAASTYFPTSQLPDIAVATPGGLVSFLSTLPSQSSGGGGGGGGGGGVSLSQASFLSSVRHVVLDEADALLQGAHAKDIDLLFQAFRLNDKRRRLLCYAAEAEMYKTEIESRDGEGEVGGTTTRIPDWVAADASLKFRAKQILHKHPQGVKEALKLMGITGKASRRESFYWERQLIFAGATMPHTGKRGVVEMVLGSHPDAAWVNGRELHKSKSVVRHRWAEVENSHLSDALLAAVQSCPDYQNGAGKTLVFVNGKQAADTAHRVLTQGGIPALLYRGGMTTEELAKALHQMQTTPGSVMVCTDSASRGVDIPGVTHVVQAQFAPTAVDFLHRIGRTARAGASGKVTSLYTSQYRELAETIRMAIKEDRPVERAFSRKRSFSKKVKRHGLEHVQEQVLSDVTVAEIFAGEDNRELREEIVNRTKGGRGERKWGSRREEDE